MNYACWSLMKTPFARLASYAVYIIASMLHSIKALRDGARYWLTSSFPLLHCAYKAMISPVRATIWQKCGLDCSMTMFAKYCVPHTMEATAQQSTATKNCWHVRQWDTTMFLSWLGRIFNNLYTQSRFIKVCLVSRVQKDRSLKCQYITALVLINPFRKIYSHI